jgi:site-specific DNA recombinase
MRAAFYARFSTDLQDCRSLADQIALAKSYAERNGFTGVGAYEDGAISGASTLNRGGLQRLLSDAKAKRFDVIVTESLDRLSRSQADTATLYENLSFLGVCIHTLADGLITELHVGIKGTMSALFLKDLAQKTRRGQIGRVKAGRIPGGKSYGYDIVQAGEERGQRTINSVEAEVVRRAYREYAGGKGPLGIVQDFNNEGIKSPSGGLWNASTLLGSQKRRNGILNNELYRGIIVYNRQRFLKDPSTGKRVARENPQSEWYCQEVSELRIIDEGLWEAVQALRSTRGGPHLYQQRRPQRLLSGLLRCAKCGGRYSVVKDDRMRCSTRQNSRACDNSRTICVSQVEERVLLALRQHLLAPDVVAAAVEAYREERRKLSEQRKKQRVGLEREAIAIARRLANFLEMIETGLADPKASAQRFNELVEQQREIERALAEAQRPDKIELHPQAAARYRAMVSDIHAAIRNGNQATPEVIALIRDLIDHIVVIPTPKPDPLGLEVVGSLAALLSENPQGTIGAESLVAGAGFEPAAFRL